MSSFVTTIFTSSLASSPCGTQPLPHALTFFSSLHSVFHRILLQALCPRKRYRCTWMALFPASSSPSSPSRRGSKSALSEASSRSQILVFAARRTTYPLVQDLSSSTASAVSSRLHRCMALGSSCRTASISFSSMFFPASLTCCSSFCNTSFPCLSPIR